MLILNNRNMKPTTKSTTVENLLTSLSGISRHEAMKRGHCTTCDGYITGFKDRLSEVEHRISGVCQKCQDRVFG